MKNVPLYGIWEQWALAGTMALRSGNPSLVMLFLRVTNATTATGMIKSGMRPASRPTSASKE